LEADTNIKKQEVEAITGIVDEASDTNPFGQAKADVEMVSEQIDTASVKHVKSTAAKQAIALDDVDINIPEEVESEAAPYQIR